MSTQHKHGRLERLELTNTDRQADIDIKQLFFSASKAFKDKSWVGGEAGIGFAVNKLKKKSHKPQIVVRVAHDDRVFVVPTNKLIQKIEEKDCFNYNGSQLCGYITKSDLYSLARASKKDTKDN